MMTSRPHILVLMTIVALVVGAAGATATPEQVISDHADNGILDGTYSAAELEDALVLAQRLDGPSKDHAIQVIRDAEFDAFFGVTRNRTARPSGVAATEASRAPSVVPLELPRAPAAPPGASVPLAFVVLSIMAGLLMAAGAASTLIRRFAASPQQPTHRLGRR